MEPTNNAYLEGTERMAPIQQEEMKALRDRVKKSPWTYADIGHQANVSPAHVSNVLRGNYPYDGANKLPKNIREALQNYGFTVPDILKTF